jgi:hypothetical protein
MIATINASKIIYPENPILTKPQEIQEIQEEKEQDGNK